MKSLQYKIVYVIWDVTIKAYFHLTTPSKKGSDYFQSCLN